MRRSRTRYIETVAPTCLNYWITFTWSISGVAYTGENIIHKGVAGDDASAIWISGDFYIRENSKTRQRPVSRSTDHSRFCASLLPTLVLQSTRLNRTNVGVPARHVCKGASYSLDANPHRWYRFCCPLGKFDTKSTYVYLRIFLGCLWLK